MDANSLRVCSRSQLPEDPCPATTLLYGLAGGAPRSLSCHPPSHSRSLFISEN